jgi:DNA helicase-2/ATP-dependent DNA helicase PcrA
MCNPATLAGFQRRGYVVAPAGFGKTHLIADATALSAGRQLILTHTYAGVNALRRKMQLRGVSDKLYRIDTIASWALRLSLSYSTTSGWTEERPADGARWNALYDACSALLDRDFIRRIVRASYVGLYVDEYQDCSVAQHNIVLKIARDLPCRVLGDPLQGIFDFEGQHPVDWVRDVEGNFERLGTLEIPHRWGRAGAPELGDWLRGVRALLEQGHPVDLAAARPRSVRVVEAASDPRLLFQQQGNTCRYFPGHEEHTVVAIHKGDGRSKARCHALSRVLGGRYSSIEEVEGKDVFAFLRKIERAPTNARRLKAVIEFAAKCMTGVENNLPAATIRGEHTEIRANTRNPLVAALANAYLAAPGSGAMAALLKGMTQTAGVRVIRADLFNRVMAILRKQAMHPQENLQQVGDRYQREFRFVGRPVGHRRIIGTTLLVKGLEYDHAIVLDATSLSRKDLYVALTRGARTLTIITTGMLLNPRD